MKKELKISVIAIFFLLKMVAVTAQSFVVVSDYDDTYRVTGAATLPKLFNALCTNRIYAGADVLYRGFGQKAEAVYIVSNSPQWLRQRIERQLNVRNVKPDSVFLFHGQGERMAYKLASIRQIAARHPAAQLVLLGDDVTADHLIYDSIRREMPRRVAAIYIRPVVGRTLAAGIYRYYTEFEIAYNEQLNGRLEMQLAEQVAKTIQATRPRNVAPDALRPTEMPTISSGNAALDSLHAVVWKHWLGEKQ